MTLSRRRVSDANGLRALSHPLRLSLLELLSGEGPKTASQAAIILGDSPSNCSWHLRKLAQHGFVRETRGANGRERPWQVVVEALTWEHDEHPAATEGLTDMLLERELQRLRAARAAGDPTRVVNRQVWLTADDAAALGEELESLLARYAERGSDEARRVSMVAWLAPSGPNQLPG